MHLKYGGNWKKISEKLPGRPADSIKNRYYSTLKKRLPPELRSSRSRYLRLMPSVPEPATTPALPDIPSIDKFFAFEEPPKPAAPPLALVDEQQTLNAKQKKERIMNIYSKMARLEAFLNHTKQEIKKIEKHSFGDGDGARMS
jgi:hypothetical protein